MQQQTKVLSASQVKNSFGALVKQVYTGKLTEVVIQNHGQEVAALIGRDELAAIRKLREEEKRRKALEDIREVRASVQANLKEPLTDEEVDTIAERFSRELIEDMVKEGKIRFAGTYD